MKCKYADSDYDVCKDAVLYGSKPCKPCRKRRLRDKWAEEHELARDQVIRIAEDMVDYGGHQKQLAAAVRILRLVQGDDS